MADDGAPELHVHIDALHLHFDVVAADELLDAVVALPAEIAEGHLFHLAQQLLEPRPLGERQSLELARVAFHFAGHALPGEPFDAEVRGLVERIVEQFRPDDNHGGLPRE
jgi:hypothetical protein